MHFSKSRWLRRLWLALLPCCAMIGASTLAQESGSLTATSDEGQSTLQIVSEIGSTEEADDGETTVDPAQQPADQPDVPTNETPAEAGVSTAASPGHAGVSAEGQSGQAIASGEAETAGEIDLEDAPIGESSASGQQPLTPVPDPEYSPDLPVEVATASFDGITPGASTLAEVKEAWGEPVETADRNAQLVHLYSVEPFDRVEVSFVGNQVASIVIRLDRPFPAKSVAEQLQLSNVRPVLVANELGSVLGQSFPERGVLFAFAPNETPGTASMKVVQIILEPVTAEPFVLRAETNMENKLESSISDLGEALKIDPEQARAHWLKARLLTTAGEPQAALEAAGEAVRLEPQEPKYRLARAEALSQLGRFTEAIQEAQQALPNSDRRPHVKARALCLLGDLVSSGPNPDYRRAMQYHSEAIITADPAAVSRHPAVRLAAVEVLIDSYLGAAHDVAWGPWDQKETAVPRWLERAAVLAKDFAENDGGSLEYRFRVATRALGAHVGVRGELDPGQWTEEALGVAKQLIDSIPESPQRQQVRWDLGMALYDIVQVYQMRGDHATALDYGKQAIEYLEGGPGLKQASLSEAYLLGRLYFRLGAIYSVGMEDHLAALPWFEKAIPVFEKSAQHLTQKEFGRLGETFVSMGVSYWESQQRDRALILTQQGAQLMQQSAANGGLPQTSLEVPYSNLATMYRQLGRIREADEYTQQAQKYKDSQLR